LPGYKSNQFAFDEGSEEIDEDYDNDIFRFDDDEESNEDTGFFRTGNLEF